MKYSVVVPTYNVEKFIESCIRSILLAATFTLSKIEVIIADDASNDSTVDTIRAVISQECEVLISVLTSVRNRGPSATRNAAILRSSGEYVLFVDGDNMVRNEIFVKLDCLTAENPEVDVFILGMALFDNSGKVQGVFYGDRIREDVEAHLNGATLRLLQGNFLDNFSLVKREIALKFQYDENIRSLEDWDLWIRLTWLAHAKFMFVAALLGMYRVREGSLTRDMDDIPVFARRQMIRVYSKLLLYRPDTGLPAALDRPIIDTIRGLARAIIEVTD